MGVFVAMDKLRFILEIISLVFLTVTEIAVFVTNGLSSAGNPSRFGFINNTGAISDTFYTQVRRFIAMESIFMSTVIKSLLFVDHTCWLYFYYLGIYLHLGSLMDNLCLVVCL